MGSGYVCVCVCVLSLSISVLLLLSLDVALSQTFIVSLSLPLPAPLPRLKALSILAYSALYIFTCWAFSVASPNGLHGTCFSGLSRWPILYFVGGALCQENPKVHLHFGF